MPNKKSSWGPLHYPQMEVPFSTSGCVTYPSSLSAFFAGRRPVRDVFELHPSRPLQRHHRRRHPAHAHRRNRHPGHRVRPRNGKKKSSKKIEIEGAKKLLF